MYGVGRDVCEVPLDHLVGGERWRDARFDEYVERLNEIREACGGRERTVSVDRKLDRLIDFRVDRLIASVRGLA